MMRIIIKISEKAYNALTHTEFDANLVVDEMRKAIVNGTPLPKHGRLIDADNITFSQFFDAGDYAQAMRGIYEAPTIIESDKESKDGDSD